MDSTRRLVRRAGVRGTILSTLVFAPEFITPEGSGDTPPLWFQLLQYVVMLSFASVPVAMGFAVLKYRLYDIDILINRTLVYGSLTATLVALYFVGIVVLQRLFVSLTGEKSTLAVVASTLAIAALEDIWVPVASHQVVRAPFAVEDVPLAAIKVVGRPTAPELVRTGAAAEGYETSQNGAISLWYVSEFCFRDTTERLLGPFLHGAPRDSRRRREGGIMKNARQASS